MTIEELLVQAAQHELEHPDHGVNCACQDETIRQVRIAFRQAYRYIPERSRWQAAMRVVHVLVLASSPRGLLPIELVGKRRSR